MDDLVYYAITNKQTIITIIYFISAICFGTALLNIDIIINYIYKLPSYRLLVCLILICLFYLLDIRVEVSDNVLIIIGSLIIAISIIN